MAKMKTTKAAPLTWWIFPGFGVSILVFLVVCVWTAWMSGNLLFRDDSLPRPPEPLDLPWVSGWVGWGFLLLCAGTTALALWLDRESERRVEPLAMIALCLTGLGYAEAISGANVMANYPDSWPVNRVEVAVWILVAAAGVGVLAWIRILLSNNLVRGRIFATCALVCSLSTAWIVNTFLIDSWLSPILEDGIELPVAYHSRRDRPDPDEYRPVILIQADGSKSHESLESLARDMEQRNGYPDEPILIRADRRASWSAVSRVLAEVQEAGIWRLIFSTRWQEPAARTIILGYLPREADDPVEDEALQPASHVLRISADGTLHFDDVLFVDRASLCDRLDQLPPRQFENGSIIRIESDEEARWGDVVKALSAATHSFHEIHLGPFNLSVH